MLAGLVPSGGSGGESISLPFQPLEAACISWLVTLSWHHPDLCFPPHISFCQLSCFPLSLTRPCDYTGCTRIAQDNLLISRSLTQSYLQSPPPNIFTGSWGEVVDILGGHYSIDQTPSASPLLLFFCVFCLLKPGPVLNVLHGLTHLIFTIILEERVCYYR